MKTCMQGTPLWKFLLNGKHDVHMFMFHALAQKLSKAAGLKRYFGIKTNSRGIKIMKFGIKQNIPCRKCGHMSFCPLTDQNFGSKQSSYSSQRQPNLTQAGGSEGYLSEPFLHLAPTNRKECFHSHPACGSYNCLCVLWSFLRDAWPLFGSSQPYCKPCMFSAAAVRMEPSGGPGLGFPGQEDQVFCWSWRHFLILLGDAVMPLSRFRIKDWIWGASYKKKRFLISSTTAIYFDGFCWYCHMTMSIFQLLILCNKHQLKFMPCCGKLRLGFKLYQQRRK